MLGQDKVNPFYTEENDQPKGRSMLRRIVALVVMALLSVWTPSADAQDVNWVERLNHTLGITFEAPQSFMLRGEDYYEYISDLDTLRLTPEYTYRFDRSDSTRQKCESIASEVLFTEYEVIRQRQPGVCLFNGTFGYDFAVVLPGDFTNLYSYYDYLSIQAPGEYLETIATSVQFVDWEDVSAVHYIQGVLEILQANYVYRDRVKWETISRKALRQVDARTSLEEAHDVVQYIFDQIAVVGGHQGRMFAPEDWEMWEYRGWENLGLILDEPEAGYPVVAFVYPTSSADSAGIRVGDSIETLDGVDYYQADVPDGRRVRLGIRRQGRDELIQLRLSAEYFERALYNTGRRIGNRLGYVETFSYDASGYSALDYIDASHEVFRDVDRRSTCGWVVDARRNEGGLSVVMGLAIAPLRGEGVWFGFQNYEGNVTWLDYQNGTFESYLSSYRWIDNPYEIEQKNPPVAVLVSRLTASMGELTAYVFQSRETATTRIFGEPTYGVMNDALVNYTLIDGASMYVVSDVIVDAQGNVLPEAIQPDEVMNTDYRRFGSDDDPLIQAAQDWLLNQPECD